MPGTWLQSFVARRSFLTRLGTGIGILGATSVASAAALAAASPAAAPPAAPKEWKPARHEQDNWLDEVPGVHRFMFDTTTAPGFDAALRFANNYYFTNKMAYDLKDSDLAVLLIARARSTAFGYSDAMWAKYGMVFSQQSGFTDPKTKQPPTVNFYAKADDGSGDPVAGAMQTLIKAGVRIGVCAAATRNIAQRVAMATNGDRDAINKELSTNLICPNARMVPAGIVAVNRAQERGYSLVSPG
jgi:intracellular sulfur oxidation DsrE/DsrF family protein